MSAAAAGRPLQEWFSEWLDSTTDDLLYKQAAKGQVMFIRDTLGRALVSEWKRWEGVPVVIGEHRSKSVRLPVYHIALPDMELVLRDNFYDWKVSVRSDAPIRNVAGWGLFDEADERGISACYCEGFPREWVQGPYAKDKRRFTVELSGQYDLYAFCLLLRGKR